MFLFVLFFQRSALRKEKGIDPAHAGVFLSNPPCLTRALTLCSSYFWLLNGTGCVINLFWAGLNMHAVDVFTLNGIERDHVASLTVR
jgi:hypothetical protein